MERITEIYRVSVRAAHAEKLVSDVLAQGGEAAAVLEEMPMSVLDETLVGAVQSGSYQVAEILLQHGANPNALGGAPLLAAVAGGWAGTVRLLIQHGVDPRPHAEEIRRAVAPHWMTDVRPALEAALAGESVA